MSAWIPGGLFDNINKFANSLGYQNAGIIMTLSMVPWESPDERDLFIQSITGKPVQGDDSRKF